MKRLILLSLISAGFLVGLSPGVRATSLATDETNFTGVVPGTCTITGVDDVVMTLDGTTFTGTTDNIAITSNVPTSVSLSQITDNNDTDNDSAATADINDITGGANNILTTDASESSASSSSALTNQTLDQAHNVTIKMTVVNADTVGNYSYTITLSCLQ